MKPASIMAPPIARGFFDPDRKPQRPAALPVAVAPPFGTEPMCQMANSIRFISVTRKPDVSRVFSSSTLTAY